MSAAVPSSRIVFLDFDGVLNAPSMLCETSKLHDALRLSRTLIGRLNKICHIGQANVVLSTSWRPTRKNSPWDLSNVQSALDAVGFEGRLVGTTPDFGQWLEGEGWLEHPAEDGIDEAIWAQTLRAREILAWVKNHPVASFVVLDADVGATVPGHFVHVDSKVGLTGCDVERALEILRCDAPIRS